MSNDKEQSRQSSMPVSDDVIFKVTKEIVVKFIEVGRLTPANFSDTYNMVFTTIKESVRPE